MVHRRWIVNAASAITGEVISFQSSTNPELYLALDTNDSAVKGLDTNDFAVKGLVSALC